MGRLKRFSVIHSIKHKAPRVRTESESENTGFNDFIAKYRSELDYKNSYCYLQEPIKLLNAGCNLAFLKGSQVGASELMITYILYLMIIKKLNIFYLLPTSADASDFSAARINHILSKIDVGFEYDNVGHKRLGTSNLYLRGSNSIARLKSVPVDCLIIDEYDEMKEESVRVVRERLSASQFRQQIYISTPTIPGWGIFNETKNMAQYNYIIKHECGCEINASDFFDTIVDLDREEYVCNKCKEVIREDERTQLIREGFWRCVTPGRDYCFHIPQFLSSTITAKDISAEYNACDSDIRRQVFWNHKLGLPYVSEGTRLTKELILKRVGNVGGYEHHAGVDVSQGGLHYVVVIQKYEGVLMSVVDAFRCSWEQLYGELKERNVICVVIDANPERHAARNFQSQWGDCYLALYPNGLRTLYAVTDENYIKINRTEGIDKIFDRFKKDTIQIREAFTSTRRFDEFCSHLCSVVRQYRETRSGIEAYYVETGADHYLHALVYADAAFSINETYNYNYDRVVGSFI